jgi:hypothetical protein
MFLFYFAERFRSDISRAGTQSGSAATVTDLEIVCNAWFGGVVFVSGSRDIHARGFDFISVEQLFFFRQSGPIFSSIERCFYIFSRAGFILPNVLDQT